MNSNALAALAALLLAASSARAEDDVSFTFGSNPDKTVELGAVIFAAGLKNRSHFGFGETGSRNGELAFHNDLGLPSTLFAPGVRFEVNAGPFGWVGGELLGFEERDEVCQLGRERVMEKVILRQGDVLRASIRTLWGGLHYGFEGRLRLLGFLDVALSPTFGFGFMDMDAWNLRRVVPSPTGRLGGDTRAFVLAPGFHFEVEAFSAVRLGAEGEFGLTSPPISMPKMTLWERVRVYAGVTFFGADLTIGWRMAATHFRGDGSAVDLRLRGFDATIGVRF